MNNSTPEFHPIYSLAQTAIGQLGGTCLAEDAARAACNVLAESWASNIRLGYGNGGPNGPEVEQMILGDLRDTLDALERLLGVIERQGDE